MSIAMAVAETCIEECAPFLQSSLQMSLINVWVQNQEDDAHENTPSPQIDGPNPHDHDASENTCMLHHLQLTIQIIMMTTLYHLL